MVYLCDRSAVYCTDVTSYLPYPLGFRLTLIWILGFVGVVLDRNFLLVVGLLSHRYWVELFLSHATSKVAR